MSEERRRCLGHQADMRWPGGVMVRVWNMLIVLNK